ncbi:mechanosensitive ion channel protein MscS [Defluviimonas sp. 20V17]|uniref:Small-conductance mechanosensitive channel n=1 Tax=Allgaiera indica TaxID=765699 RepID=A0AAN4UPJ9_9RHOB|nr:mechanosensitive ion channel domain-containing protein [Allgaiera indica]KDB04732.1 mechanosensitive ion channel protein MscS [Defluviimonas sp. 20V17]GHD99105.1 mechanosensitive ion channel protein [Allgaiera indica]SDW00499.1 small conductance mechanosensitive channel [Allgaiera indica]
MTDLITNIFHTPLLQGKSIADVVTIPFLASVAGSTLTAIAILVAGFILGRWADQRISGLSQRYARLDDTLFTFLGNITRYAVLTFTVLFVLNTFGIQTTSIVAVIGAAGLAVGLALQGTLSNVAAGVMIIVFRPFKLGDFVAVASTMGTVKSINLNFIELATIDNLQVIVPNAKVWGNMITNYSVYPTRRAEWTFGVGYASDLSKVEGVIREVLAADARSLSDPEPFVQVAALNDSSVDFLVRNWVARADYFAYRNDITRKIKEAFDAHGIDIPFPTRTMVAAGGVAPIAPGEEATATPPESGDGTDPATTAMAAKGSGLA